MTGFSFHVLAAMIASATLAHADKPLAEAAKSFEKDLPVGCLVSGESIDGKTDFAVLGKAEPEGVATEKRIFEIGSISKVFTGLLLADAVEKKKLRLDSTLKEVLGPKQSFADEHVAGITLLQLSTHTSGLPRLPDNMGPNPDAEKDPYGKYDREKMRAFLAKVKLSAAPPCPASYSNFGAGLLGDILAETHGKSWEAAVKEVITGPLGMSDTVVTLNAEQTKRLVPPYRGTDKGTSWTFQAMAGAGALRSTAADLLKFGAAIADPDKVPALAPALRRMMEVRAPFADVGGEIGLGIFIGKLDGERDYWHNGGTGGYRSVLQVIPARKLVRVVLVNNDTIPAERVVAAARTERPQQQVTAAKLSAEELDAFTGVYEIGPTARFTVLRRDDGLWVRLTGQAFYPVTPLGNDRFRYANVTAELQFTREGGKPVSVVLHQNGREVPAKRMDEKPPAILFPKAADLQAYTGDYELAPGRVITVTVSDDTLMAQLTGQPVFPVFSTKADYFEYDIVKAALEFEKKDGKVTALVLHQNGDHRAERK